MQRKKDRKLARSRRDTKRDEEDCRPIRITSTRERERLKIKSA
jgi:hypothetical protein